jgi:hypothetical protein
MFEQWLSRLLTQSSQAQTAIAYPEFTVNRTVGTKDVYVFTSPEAFNYTKGVLSHLAIATIEKGLNL